MIRIYKMQRIDKISIKPDIVGIIHFFVKNFKKMKKIVKLISFWE